MRPRGIGAGRPQRVGSHRTAAPERTGPPSTASSDGEPESPPSNLPFRVLKVAGSVLAPATLVTALMYQFGLLHAFWFFGTFGVDYTVFDLTTQDYLLRSADGLFIPLTVVAGVGLVVLWGYRLLPARPDSTWRTAVAPAAVALLAGLGALCVALAVIGLVAPSVLVRYVALPGVALSSGTILLLAASRLHRWRRRQPAGSAAPDHEPTALLAAEWTAVFVLVSIGLFWAVGDWSAAVGTRRGQQVLNTLNIWPDAVIYSNQRLNLSSVGVREIRCAGEETAYRYDRMHLVTQEGGRYLLLPTDWQTYRHAIVLPATDDVRLAFADHGTPRPADC